MPPPKKTPQKVTQRKPRKKKPAASAGDWRPAFLKSLSEFPVVKTACSIAKVSRKTAYQHKREDASFSEEWDEAFQDGLGVLEQVAVARAIESSDRLLEWLLKKNLPEKYGDTVRFESTDGQQLFKVFNGIDESKV